MAIRFLTGETIDGQLKVDTSSANPLLVLFNTSNGSGSTIRFSDQTTQTQVGDITFYHSDSASQGGGASWHFVSEPDTVLVVGSGSVNGRFVAKSAGSAGEVDYGFYDDVNTGMYRAGADSLRLVAGGASGVSVSSTAVGLRYAGSTKLATVNGGVDITGNGNFSGDITVSGGDITLGGTGRIQGVDTVSASTDAANKLYVDNAVSNSMSSWTLSGDSGTNQIISDANTVDIAGGTNISTVVGATDTVTINMDTGGIGSGTYGSTSNSTKIDTISVDAYGRVTGVATGATGSGSMSSFTLTGDSGTNQTISNGNTLDIAGGTNISTVVGSTDTVTVNMDTGGIGSGTYGSTSDGTKIDTITVDAYGRVTAVATGSTGTGTVTGSGGSGRVAFWTSGSVLGSDVNFHYDNTNERLALSAGSGTPSAQIELGQNGDDLKIDIVGETGGKPQIQFKTGSTNRGTITATASGDFSVISGGFLSLGANGSTMASIATSGDFTIDYDLNVVGGDLSLSSTKVISNSASNSNLVIGDVDSFDEIEQIDFLTFGTSQMTVMDDEIVVNCSQVNLSSNTNINLGQSSQFAYNSTASATTNGLFMPTGLGTSQSVNQGQLYAYTTLGTWSATGNTSANSERLLAIAAGNNVLDGMLIEGVFESTSHGFSRGQALYIGSTAGTLTQTPPSAPGSYARVVGYALNTNYILFKPDNTWVELS